jgi:hypothetical protein
MHYRVPGASLVDLIVCLFLDRVESSVSFVFLGRPEFRRFESKVRKRSTNICLIVLIEYAMRKFVHLFMIPPEKEKETTSHVYQPPVTPILQNTKPRCYFPCLCVAVLDRIMRSRSHIYIDRLPSHVVDRVKYRDCLKRDMNPVTRLFLGGRNICVEQQRSGVRTFSPKP